MLDELPPSRLFEVAEERLAQSQAHVYFHESLVCTQARNNSKIADSVVLAFSRSDNPGPSREYVFAQMRKWSGTDLPGVYDEYGNESPTYGPYAVSKEAKYKNTEACLQIGEPCGTL